VLATITDGGVHDPLRRLLIGWKRSVLTKK